MFKQKLMSHLAKKGKELDPLEKDAKVGVIRELSIQAGNMMGDKMKGLHKGLSDEDADLKHPAEDSVAEHTGSPAKGGASDGDVSPEEGSPEEEASESPEMEKSEDEMDNHEDAEYSPEELDQKIKDLMALKAHKESKANKY